MGGSGQFLESGGFRPPYLWHTVDYIEGIKILEKKDKSNKGLPWYSNTPGTKYITLDENDKYIKQIRVYGEDRTPLYDIDYHPINGIDYLLHIHYFPNNIREGEHFHRKLTKDFFEFQKFKNIIEKYIPKGDL